MQTIYLSDLDWAGIDAFARPTWRHAATFQHYCLVDTLVAPGVDASREAMAALIDNPFTPLYRKGDDMEGEPEEQVLFELRPPAVRCIFAPEGQTLFTQGKAYRLGSRRPEDGCEHNPRCAEIRDDQGQWRHFQAEPKNPGVVNTGVTAIGGRNLALFEYLAGDPSPIVSATMTQGSRPGADA